MKYHYLQCLWLLNIWLQKKYFKLNAMIHSLEIVNIHKNITMIIIHPAIVCSLHQNNTDIPFWWVASLHYWAMTCQNRIKYITCFAWVPNGCVTVFMMDQWSCFVSKNIINQTHTVMCISFLRREKVKTGVFSVQEGWTVNIFIYSKFVQNL